MTYKHFFFDMDGTLSESRSKIHPELIPLLQKLPNVIVISGALEEQMKFQVEEHCHFLMPQNGNHCIAHTGDHLWYDELGEEERKKIFEHIKLLNPEPTEDMISDRGCQISYSFIGHTAPLPIKKAFDPDRKKRQEAIKNLPAPEGIEVKIAGTASLDYFCAGKHKGTNVARLIEHMGWDKNECVYIGDSLMPGGNDETVVGVIETIEVRDPEHTVVLIKELLGEK